MKLLGTAKHLDQSGIFPEPTIYEKNILNTGELGIILHKYEAADVLNRKLLRIFVSHRAE